MNASSHFFRYGAFILILAIGASLRLPRLAERPMHTDEAVHALKFGALLEEHEYRYDPVEFHGPTLNYFTLIPAWLTGARTLAETRESTLRIVPVFFGLALIAGILLLKKGLGPSAVLWAGLFTAISPAMAYYSRYYIQEMLLVTASFGAMACAYRYLSSRRLLWALGAGACTGLMHASKETAAIVLGAMGLALFLLWLSSRRKPLAAPSAQPRTRLNLSGWPIALALLSGLAVSALFYSSFLRHPEGIADSFLTYLHYFRKAGQPVWHEHGPFYYVGLLLAFRNGGPLWSEAMIFILAAAGVIAAFRRPMPGSRGPGLARFIAAYTIILMVLYSLLPYKTPWTLLGFHHGLILLSGIGTAWLLEGAAVRRMRIAVAGLIAAGSVLLLIQSFGACFRYADDPAAPYVYAHTIRDIYRLTNAVGTLTEASPEGKELPIEVICAENDYWPLPWYFRAYTHTGWYNTVDFGLPPAPVIVASARFEPDIIRKCYTLPPPGEKTLYMTLFERNVELRPGVELSVFVRKDLYDRMAAYGRNP